jgi:hypothetical protein
LKNEIPKEPNIVGPLLKVLSKLAEKSGVGP